MGSQIEASSKLFFIQIMKNRAVVIPIYKSEMTSSELVSFKRTLSVFNNELIFLVLPRGLDIKNYTSLGSDIKIIEFEAHYFKNIAGYNKLMLSGGFYKAFLDFEFILICQLDVYVFENKLDYWVAQNYDYVGAPWIEMPPTHKKPIINVQNWFVGNVGNGGFSLRKVTSHYKTVRFLALFIKLFKFNEDMFFGLIINWLNPFFKKPSWQQALGFAFEMNPLKAFELNNKNLPMAVHAWEKYDKEFWKQWIK